MTAHALARRGPRGTVRADIVHDQSLRGSDPMTETTGREQAVTT